MKKDTQVYAAIHVMACIESCVYLRQLQNMCKWMNSVIKRYQFNAEQAKAVRDNYRSKFRELANV